ncbi:unnamed protein product, partial [Owenia fusiformis]
KRKMDQVQARVQSAITEAVNTLDKEHLRKMQADMYKCSAACCEKPYYSMDQVQNCVEKCSGPINQGQRFMQTEMQNYQDRLQRCALDCQDTIRDKVGPNTSEAEVAKHKKDLEKCVVKCADTHIGAIPSMLTRMRDTLKKLESANAS